MDVFPASEMPIPGISGKTVATGVMRYGDVKEVYYVEYQDKEGKKAVSVSKLMKSVFFPYLSDWYTLKPLYTHHNLELRWDVKKLIAINNVNSA